MLQVVSYSQFELSSLLDHHFFNYYFEPKQNICGEKITELLYFLKSFSSYLFRL